MAFASGLAEVLAEGAPILDERQRRVLAGAGCGVVGGSGSRWSGAPEGRGPPGGSGEGPAGMVGVGQDGGPGDQGNPMSPLRWTTKLTVKLAAELA